MPVPVSACEQHGRVRLRDLVRHVEDLLHRRGVADDPLEGVTRLDLASQVDVLRTQPIVRFGEGVGELGVLARQLVDLEPALHGDPQVVGLPGLRDVAPDPTLVDRGDQRRHVRITGQHHADRARVALDHALEELDAGHAGHHLVGHHHRDVLAIEDREPLLGARRREDAVLGAKRQFETLEDRLLVVDDQDPVGR